MFRYLQFDKVFSSQHVFTFRHDGLNNKNPFNDVPRVIERGRVKCGQYWPLEEGRTEQHGYFLVRNTHIQVFQDFKLSHLELYNTQVNTIHFSLNQICLKEFRFRKL